MHVFYAFWAPCSQGAQVCTQATSGYVFQLTSLRAKHAVQQDHANDTQDRHCTHPREWHAQLLERTCVLDTVNFNGS